MNTLIESSMSGGAILMAVLIALTTALNWPKWLNYLWAGLVLVWGLVPIM